MQTTGATKKPTSIQTPEPTDKSLTKSSSTTPSVSTVSTPSVSTASTPSVSSEVPKPKEVVIYDAPLYYKILYLRFILPREMQSIVMRLEKDGFIMDKDLHVPFSAITDPNGVAFVANVLEQKGLINHAYYLAINDLFDINNPDKVAYPKFSDMKPTISNTGKPKKYIFRRVPGVTVDVGDPAHPDTIDETGIVITATLDAAHPDMEIPACTLETRNFLNDHVRFTKDDWEDAENGKLTKPFLARLIRMLNCKPRNWKDLVEFYAVPYLEKMKQMGIDTSKGLYIPREKLTELKSKKATLEFRKARKDQNKAKIISTGPTKTPTKKPTAPDKTSADDTKDTITPEDKTTDDKYATSPKSRKTTKPLKTVKSRAKKLRSPKITTVESE